MFFDRFKVLTAVNIGICIVYGIWTMNIICPHDEYDEDGNMVRREVMTEEKHASKLV